MNIADKLNRLIDCLAKYPQLTIAVSGGIDSMLLSFVSHLYFPKRTLAVHAHSPAVPKKALQRVLNYTHQYEWNLKVLDAGEFADPDYLKNPINRCYFCKSNLYSRLRGVRNGVVMSGTNIDDLADFRPGLKAAEEQQVVHPYIEAELTKADIYALAAEFNLTDLEHLPSQPCLASRVETGITIAARDLQFIDQVEDCVRQLLADNGDIRCRITHQGVFVEISPLPKSEPLAVITESTKMLCQQQGYLFSGIRTYRQGSAFIQPEPYYAAV
ncbi:hypothetical protein [Algibacillus agarilyticus]|uniref:hypothetical protein n=1 Tax=Algibacillus agarilyticus TaxID=2234133 RepID=UPI000DD0836D|nr:hypothetical protein [Algibacillus agarilyticus]